MKLSAGGIEFCPFFNASFCVSFMLGLNRRSCCHKKYKLAPFMPRSVSRIFLLKFTFFVAMGKIKNDVTNFILFVQFSIWKFVTFNKYKFFQKQCYISYKPSPCLKVLKTFLSLSCFVSFLSYFYLPKVFYEVIYDAHSLNKK